MKKNYTLLFIAFISSTSFGQYMHQQYFDGANTSPSNSLIINLDTASSNIWQVGKPQKTIFHTAATVPKALITDTVNYYPVNNTSIFTFSFHNAGSVTALQWMQKLDMDPHHHDGGIVEFSSDSGTTWQNAFNNIHVLNFYGFQTANKDTAYTGAYAFSGKDTTWRNVWLCFKPGTFVNYNQKVMFRFTLKTDSINNNKEGWLIDNMIEQSTFVHPVNEMKKAENLKVYPTITDGIIRIENTTTNDLTPLQNIELIGVDGKVLERYTNSSSKYQIDISRFEGGMYFLKITSIIRTENHPIMLIKN